MLKVCFLLKCTVFMYIVFQTIDEYLFKQLLNITVMNCYLHLIQYIIFFWHDGEYVKQS